MKRVSLFTAAMTALLLGGTSARADFIEWTYNWTPSATTLLSDTSPTSMIRLTNEPVGKPFANAAGSSDIVATNVTVLSDAPRGNPDLFTTNGGLSLRLRLTDKASGEFADLNFSGKFNGTLSAQSANLDFTFNTPMMYVVELGLNEYTIAIGPYSPPGPPESENAGSIAAHIEVRALDIAKVPEPSTMILSCVGLSFVGAASWRKRRQQAKA